MECAVDQLSTDDKCRSHGSVYTKSEVVEFILDLLGYKAGKPLYEFRILEPAFGGGDFLLHIIDRLFESLVINGITPSFETLKKCICAVELHRETFQQTKLKALKRLCQFLPNDIAQRLTETWLTQGDFLLEPFKADFDFVVGNPPYVRQELIPAPLLSEYKMRYLTLYDRADLYIPFFERSLSLLNSTGALGFICSDRWMKNRYGGPLRSFVSRDYHLAVYVDMVGTAAFTEEVTAYPAITIFNRSGNKPTATVHRPEISRSVFNNIVDAIEQDDPGIGRNFFKPAMVQREGMEPWILESGDQIDLLRRIEANFPSIESVGCQIGIGVATGADKCFIAPFASLDVEDDRKLRLATTKDILSGEVKWRGLGVINPFADDGRLVDLQKYPRLRSYLEARKQAIAGRHCAKRAPERWYRTIDRIWPELAARPKLLIPDIKGEAHIVYESGELYPHHNLYFITSDEWDLRALQAILLSSLTRLFIATYSTQMRGGYLRFQSQYLRRLRLPKWELVDNLQRRRLIEAAQLRDPIACNEAVFSLYNLSEKERAAVGGNGK
ncbi:MAG: Eco57I restriction-modification methylase domain-containing protein [Verrucomicrobia bacterium]|nr:Eco57I restriction-modification methylase domain-containing protein [Verrucomicrobiota bacterium]MCF7707764.1 Eco57I restriction-modification methylase domain-containing protein [Verrucomicrobiota bacterium]